MATFADFSLFQFLSPVFMFLLVFVVVYGFLNMFKMFKGLSWANGVNAIIALVCAFFVVGSGVAFRLLATMTPWFATLIIVLFLIFFVLRMFVGDNDAYFDNLIRHNALKWVIIVLFIIIVIASLSQTFGQSLLEEQVGSQEVIVDEDGNEIIVERVGEDRYQEVPARQSPQGSTATDDFGNNVLQTIIHPKVLGLILFMLIGFFTILLIAKSTQDPDV